MVGVQVAYNSLFLGEFMQPDWDMFQSRHPAADYHAAARAVGGCAVYVRWGFVLMCRILPPGPITEAFNSSGSAVTNQGSMTLRC